MTRNYYAKFIQILIIFILIALYDVLSLVFFQSIELSINNRIIFAILLFVAFVYFVRNKEERHRTALPILGLSFVNIIDICSLTMLINPKEHYMYDGRYTYNCIVNYKFYNVVECTYKPKHDLLDLGLIPEEEFAKLSVQTQSQFNLFLCVLIVCLIVAIILSKVYIKYNKEQAVLCAQTKYISISFVVAAFIAMILYILLNLNWK